MAIWRISNVIFSLEEPTYFETIEELEEVLGARCCILQEQMQEEIRNLTNYHWLNFA